VDRTLRWPDCRNVRDLGGLPTTDGGRIRCRALIRADDLCQLTPASVAALRGYGICRIIDLRGSLEAEQDPGPFAGDPMYRRVPFIDEEADRHRDPAEEATLLATYRASVVRNARHIAAGITALASAPPGGVLVHCAAGRDRTGVHVALALRVAGVAVDEIAADYALSSECTPEIIVSTLGVIEQRHGSVAGYLRGAGVATEHLTELRRRLREDPSR
jgi:protein-tyrosine phosphatase